MKTLLFIGFGGAAGAILRALVSTWLNPKSGFPFGTLSVNIIGAFLLGFLTAYTTTRIDPAWRPIIGTGFLGGLTTFSTFSIETVQLLQGDQWKTGIIYLLTQMILGLSMGALGLYLGRSL